MWNIFSWLLLLINFVLLVFCTYQLLVEVHDKLATAKQVMTNEAASDSANRAATDRALLKADCEVAPVAAHITSLSSQKAGGSSNARLIDLLISNATSTKCTAEEAEDALCQLLDYFQSVTAGKIQFPAKFPSNYKLSRKAPGKGSLEALNIEGCSELLYMAGFDDNGKHFAMRPGTESLTTVDDAASLLLVVFEKWPNEFES
jgi:hypothetical protein